MGAKHVLYRIATRVQTACIVLVVCGSGSHAGPWPQEVGSVFVASGVELGFDEELYQLGSALPVQGWSSLYAEYGLTPRVTLVLDYGRELGGVPSADAAVDERALFIARYDLAPEATWRRAVSAGFGFGQGQALQHLGLHLGRGFQSRLGSGWMTADLSLRSGGLAPEVGLEMVAGLNRSDRLKLMAGAQIKSVGGDGPDLKLTTGMAVGISRFDLELGVIAPVDDPQQARLKLALWQKF